MRAHPGYARFPDGFFARSDESDDGHFYTPIRMLQHIDDGAIAAVGTLYDELGIDGRVLDLMSSWVSHFATPPQHLSVLGMNWTELDANPMAANAVAHDLNLNPELPFNDNHFDDVVCAVSVDYLTQPLEVFEEVARVLRPGGRFVCVFSNRLFPTKAIRGWLASSDTQRCQIVATYFALTSGWSQATIEQRPTPPGADPLFAVWAVSNGSPPSAPDA